ncbi:MAG: hypothetical protein GWO11_05565 [Desulfuromonadales bacterium]|nr:hypothetical protein [Desulfuromonadales bacterium]NIR33858.1 hypothetical protein [Desulfuromonadales bacterium]NIS40009.1 hypothetical protein [Desulfuromonadales bacterium]
MRKYKVVISGRNYLLPCDGEPRKVGFFQTFYLRSSSAEQASEEAAGRITRDPFLVQNALNGSGDPFRIVVESVRPAGPLKLFAGGSGERRFFPEDGEVETDTKAAGGCCQGA